MEARGYEELELLDLLNLLVRRGTQSGQCFTQAL